MPKTYRVLTHNHAEEVRECPQGGFHEWIDGQESAYTVERRVCEKCGHAQVWRLRIAPSSTTAPQLGVWESEA